MAANWKYVPFGELFDWAEKSTIKSGEGNTAGKYKMFVCSDSEIKRYDAPLTSGEALVFGTGGKASCHYVNEPFAYSTDCAVALPKGAGYCCKFYYYFLRQNRLEKIQRTFSGSGLQHTSKKKIEKIPVPILNKKEQEHIVFRIEELFSQLDDGIENLRKIKKQLRIYRQAVLDRCFGGDVKKRKLKELCAFITKGTTPPKEAFTMTPGIPFIKVYHLTFTTELDFAVDPTFITAPTQKALSRSIVHPGDVLMNIVGPPLGKVSIVPDSYREWNINQAIARFRCLESLDNRYLAYYLLSHRTISALKEKSKATAGQVNLTLEICREFEIPVPPLEEQRRIVCEIEAKLSDVDQVEKAVDVAIMQADAIRQSILRKAFHGELYTKACRARGTEIQNNHKDHKNA